MIEDDFFYDALTRNIRVRVRPVYLDDQSEPSEDHYVWAYEVEIENEGGESVQLQDRYWRITDALGRVQEVRGDGVVGEQPVIEPGECFEYTSGAPLPTPSGIMSGTYGMLSGGGERFDVTIPAFSLDSPHDFKSVN
ncbi:Co2+/Mg2+ efflux protein ApaG [Pyruvatibacter sp.]|uniref:Co2+/Mg2+ efflux protein ApaG n=1 Tax=unclassified Pyruvatibacter TaxID=2618840 RepID=UPI0029691768|nr:Co2+/Mg2+ efflux protein ApaG [Alphaproteobacteria bacterium]